MTYYEGHAALVKMESYGRECIVCKKSTTHALTITFEHPDSVDLVSSNFMLRTTTANHSTLILYSCEAHKNKLAFFENCFNNHGYITELAIDMMTLGFNVVKYLEALNDLATRAPWVVKENNSKAHLICDTTYGKNIQRGGVVSGSVTSLPLKDKENNARFIAEIRTELPMLIEYMVYQRKCFKAKDEHLQAIRDVLQQGLEYSKEEK